MSCINWTRELIPGLRHRDPATAIAGHKALGAFDSPSQIHATRRYLTDARRLLESSESAEAFYEAMMRRHPNRVNPGALWGAAITLFPPD